MPLKKLLTIITKIFFGAFVVAYPFMIFYALQQNIAIRFLGLVLLMVVIFSFINTKNKYLFVLGLVLCFAIIFFNQEIFLKLYPVLMNASVCAIFALSLRKTPLITQFAQKMCNKPLNNNQITYTKHATIAWAVFMFINTLISFVTVFLSTEIWTIYNGFISYILIGLMMLIEYFVRKSREKCSIR